MSYTGVGVVGNHVAHEAATFEDTGLVAARDIVRPNRLGQQVVVVPAGQPIPSGVEPRDGEAIPAQPPARPPPPSTTTAQSHI